MSEIQERIFTANDDDAGVRLDKFLSAQMPEYSRSEIQKFTVARTDGAAAKMSERVRAGDAYRVEIPAPAVSCAVAAPAPDFELDILYEDDDIIVINKPRGVVMYPSAGNHTGTLVQNILAHTHLSALGGETRPGVVHRLDKDTSGVMVFAKSDAAYRELVKTFVTFVWGVPNWESADITGNIARSSRNRQKMTMVKSGGKPAHTEVAVADTWSRSRVSLLRCRLLTGRTHQIRVHLSVHGFPVLCDPVYGRGAARLGSVRNPELLEFLKTHDGQMLHAEVLEFNHPTTGAPMRFKSHMPDDMQELKAILDDAQYA